MRIPCRLTAACSAAQYETRTRDRRRSRRAHGGAVRWRCSPRFDRAFASVELREEAGAAALRAATGATVYDATIIALAVSPTLPEALRLWRRRCRQRPTRRHRLAEVRDGALCVAWDLAMTDRGRRHGRDRRRTAAFRRGPHGRAPQPAAAGRHDAIVAEGLNAPEIAPDRVLEALIEGRYAVRD